MSVAMLARKPEADPTARSNAPSKATPSRLRIGEPNDSFEREADRVADAVMAGGRARPEWSLSRMSIGAPLQRKCACGGSGECAECKEKGMLQRQSSDSAAPSSVPPVVHEVLRAPGEPLDSDTRRFFESRFGHDFGDVRVHTGDLPARSASAVNARAYTVGREVVFGRGQYQPATSDGRVLLAHELAHVIQQRSVPNPAGSSLRIDKPGSPLELAADRATHITGKGRSSPTEMATRGMLARSGLGAPMLQRWSYSGIKEDAYKAIINGGRKATNEFLNLLRKGVGLLPPALRGTGDAIVTIVDVVIGAQFAVALAVIGIIVGFSEGVVDLVRGLLGMILGVAKILFDLITGIFTNFDAAKKDLNAVWEALKGLPGAVQALISNWLDKFQKASSERQSLMIGELTGQVLALIATWAVAAGRAGTVAKVAAEGSEIGATGGTVADIATTGARATRPVLTVIQGGGEGASATSTAANTARAVVGNTARALAPEVEQAPRFVPRIVPPPVEVPVTATTSATATATASTARAVVTTAGVAASKATQISKDKEKEKKEPCGPLPILWPGLLPHPPSVRDLKRTGKEERESEGVERGRNQVNFRDCLNDARNRPHPIDPSEHCHQFGAWFDPNLTPGAPADAHHMHPLYLGGDDEIYNLGALDPKEHLQGHARLDDQSSMMETPEWQACQPISPALKNHPANQEYYIEGEK